MLIEKNQVYSCTKLIQIFYFISWLVSAVVYYVNVIEVALYTFTKTNGCVAIGRDKRMCKICVGASAAGVSRVHLKIQMRTVDGEDVVSFLYKFVRE